MQQEVQDIILNIPSGQFSTSILGFTIRIGYAITYVDPKINFARILDISRTFKKQMRSNNSYLVDDPA